jgi:transposase-like protein
MCKLLEMARKAQGNVSYYEIAKLMNVNMQQMTKWKNDLSRPNGINTLKLTELAKLSTKEAIKILEKGFSTLSFLIVTSIAYIALFSTWYISAKCILCKIDSYLKESKFKRKLTALTCFTFRKSF